MGLKLSFGYSFFIYSFGKQNELTLEILSLKEYFKVSELVLEKCKIHNNLFWFNLF